VNTANLRYSFDSVSGFDIMIQEENSLDNETTHTAESVGFIVFWGSGSITYNDIWIDPVELEPCDTLLDKTDII